MKWIKNGFIYKPDNDFTWSKTHAQVPVADFIELNNTIKIYFATRDDRGRGQIGFIIVDADKPQNIQEIGSEPVLSLGELGTFDDSGVMPSWIINHDNGDKWMYYIGWNVRNSIPYHNSVGLAISKDDGRTFNRFSKGPLWDRNFTDPFFSGSSCVIYDDNIWKIWYLSCTEWRIVKGKPEPRYHIKYAESEDGINWKRNGKIAIDYKNGNEAGIAKPSVVIENNIYRMWYSFRNFNNYRTDKNNSYRIGYAESVDGIEWVRKDNNSGISISNNPNDWDSQMIEYPHVINVKNKRLMFYNGNDFGKTGFGYAELIK